uniref:Sulfatase N-terminal domain-containing protein n=1 Tax=Heliothis virescens TaxID=7102 RepID=A0A2A4JGG1_HELVI
MVANRTTYNVIVLGIDAVSRLNFYRTMPKTVSFMKDYGAIDFLGYNKVGDNTFPNLIPLLLGNRESELKHKCLPNSKATFDNCPFVWEWFKQAGFYTAFAEDSSSLGMFNYVKSGFSRTPTDYYPHTFMTEAEANAGYNKDFNSFLCMNDYYFYQVLLDYIVNLTNTLKNNKLFGFFWEITMSHDYLNYPMVMDDNYLDFFNKLKDTNYLNKTVLFLMSDHGIRWGGIRSTKQGRLEERLPFLFIMVPPSFREEYSEAYSNLKLNSRRLTTPLDIHATLMDLVNIGSINNTVISKRSKEDYARNRSISLFLPIPSNRTCKLADIDDHWCTCHRDTVLHNESSEAIQASTHVVKHLNVLMSDHFECAPLSLVKVVEITELEAGRPDENEMGWREYTVVLQTSPGDGVFEATVRFDSRGWTLAGTVSRLNLYGDQSRCVEDYHLKLYCYCV